MTLLISRGYNGVSDPDAAAYVAAVEAADGQLLENAVGKAINAFVIGCKNDGIWTAIKASCILAGARTLNGALVPLVGTAPTNVGPFVSGDYNRKTGLVGNGTKYLDTNRAGNADPQDNQSACVCVTSAGSPSTGTQLYLGNYGAGGVANGSTNFGFDSNQLFSRSRNSDFERFSASTATGVIGVTRSSGAGYSVRAGGQNTSFVRASQTPNSANIFLYRDGSSGFPYYSNARLAFYSIGQSLDLALLDARVTTLINAFAAAIP